MSLFLERDEVARLTGRKIKSLQIVWLRKEGIPFRVAATGHPVVLRSAFDARPTTDAPRPKWRSQAVGAH